MDPLTDRRSTRTPEPVNPYAPPQADCEVPAPAGAPAISPDDPAIQEALRRLDEHLSDPAQVEADARLAGSRFRPVTIVLGAVTVVVIVSVLALLREAWFIIIPFSVVFFAIWLALLISDLIMVPRHRATDPLLALKGFWTAAKQGRTGHCLASLCPTAREQNLAPPALGTYPTGTGSFLLSSKKEVRRYLATWARPGAGQVRWFAFKGIQVEREEGDVAVVRGQLRLTAWPQWANILSLVLFLVIRLLGIIVAIALYYALRKQARPEVRKILLRGRNGLWYLYHPGLEG